jgi:hypothetical protein
MPLVLLLVRPVKSLLCSFKKSQISPNKVPLPYHMDATNHYTYLLKTRKDQCQWNHLTYEVKRFTVKLLIVVTTKDGIVDEKLTNSNHRHIYGVGLT